MAITNQERVGKALDLLERACALRRARVREPAQGAGWTTMARRYLGDDRLVGQQADRRTGTSRRCCRLMWETWNEVFRGPSAAPSARWCSELRDVRNKWAHQEPFSSDDAYRALDSAARLLTAVSAPAGRRDRAR